MTVELDPAATVPSSPGRVETQSPPVNFPDRTGRFPSLRLLFPLLILTVLLLLPALQNGYPLLYSDSGEYLLSALTRRPPRVRLVGYGLWLFATGGTVTAWAPIIAQASLLVTLLLRTLISVGVILTRRNVLLIALALLLTGAPWMASEMMPDVFAGSVLLALYLVVAHWSRLSPALRLICAATIVLGCATHVTLFLVAGLVLLGLALLRRVPRLEMPGARSVGRAAALVALSIGALALFNWMRTDRLTVTRKGSVFLVGHLVETGLAERVLYERCDRESFALCPYRAGLTRPIERFIWDDASPFYQAYQTEAQLRDDTRHLALAVIREEPVRLLASVVSYTARQFFAVQVFDAARTQPAGRFTASVVAFVLPHEESAMTGARQQGSGAISLRWLDAVILAALVVSVLVTLVMLRQAMRRRGVAIEAAEGLQLFILIALTVNALVCANLSGVFGRYQERVAWLLPVIAIAVLAGRHAGRRTVR